MSDPVRGLSGAVLVGGQSRRMGRDKALLAVDGDQLLLEHLVRLLRACCDEVLLVGGDPGRFAGLELAARWVPDATAGAGPLAGILGALQAAQNDACLILACDMPLVTVHVLEALAAAPRDSQALAYPGPMGLEPLLAIYTRACLDPLLRALTGGQLEARAFLERMDAQALPTEIVDRIDPQRRAVMNVNTPQEWAEAGLEYTLSLGS